MSKYRPTDEQYASISGNWSRYLHRLTRGSRGHKGTLTRQDLLVVLARQGGLCALTGVPMTCQLEKGVRLLTNASVDRINAGGPYDLDNIRLVCNAVNRWRSDIPDRDYIAWCRHVVAHAEREDGSG